MGYSMGLPYNYLHVFFVASRLDAKSKRSNVGPPRCHNEFHRGEEVYASYEGSVSGVFMSAVSANNISPVDSADEELVGQYFRTSRLGR